jgi:hypothetical protein
MAAKSKLLLPLSVILLALVLTSFLSPFFVARAVAFWLRYEAGRSGLTITTGAIHAPFLRPVEITDLRIVRAERDGAHFQMDASRVEAAFRVAALFDRSHRACGLRSVRLEHARVILRGRARETGGSIDWKALHALLPEQFDLGADELLFEQSVGRLEIHDAHISANNSRSGTLAIASMELSGPDLRKNFADVRGVTRWQDSRLTIGSLHLLSGLDIDSLELDLTRLQSARVAAELAVTVFNGNLRANVATEHTGKTRLWEIAGSASGISLSKIAPALGLTEPLQGSLRASKFSFRGDPRDLLHATASLWTELIGFSWRERNADVIMIGANFYQRTIQLQELYIKQSDNELTLSGETQLSADWLNPDFRGDVAGSINDLGEFAELFGASANAFAGKVAVRGRVHAHERRVDGELAITGDALKFFRNPVDSLTARLTLDSPRVHLDQFELRRGEDFVRGSGQIDFAHRKEFQLSADSWCHDLGEYDARVPLLGALAGNLFSQIDATGDERTSNFSFSAQTADSKLSARGALHDMSVAISSLTLSVNEVSAAFTGTMNLADDKNLVLSPAGDLRLAQAPQEGVCLRGIDFHQADTGTPLSQAVITQHELALSAPGSTAQTFQLCTGKDTPAQPLQINVPAPSPAPAMPLPSPLP